MYDLVFIKAAKLLSISLSIFLSGYCFMASQNALPALYGHPPHTNTALFVRIFRSGGPIAVVLALLSSISSFLLASIVTEKRELWIVVGAIPPCLGLWTAVVMMPGIRKLIAISDDKAMQDICEETGEHVKLLRNWIWQNYVRSVVVLGAGLVGLWASL